VWETALQKALKTTFEGFGGGTAFRGLSEIAGRTETFLTGAEAKAGAGTRGAETEAGAETGAAHAVEIAGTIEIGAGAGTETEAGVTLAVEIVGTIGALGIVGIAETVEAGTGTGVALGMEAFSSCARLNKNSR
jgi:hypothetical protein